MEIIKKEIRRNPLLHRDEIYLLIKSKTTPSEKEVQEIIKSNFAVPEQNIEVNKIETKFGSHEVVVYANIYESKELANKFKKAKKKKEKKEGENVKQTEEKKK